MDKIKVLIVDDSALVRRFLTETLSSDESIEVVGAAIDPIFAFSKIMKIKPDVLTLDVEMPRMDGLTFLSKLMASYPIPVVMISSYTRRGCETTMKALELGAVDFIAKPDKNLFENMEYLKSEIIRKVKNAAMANLRVAAPVSRQAPEIQVSCNPDDSREVIRRPYELMHGRKSYRVVVIGASTGGVSAIKKVVSQIDATSVPILLVLHMPGGFTASFARSLDNLLSFPVKEADTGELLKPGRIYVAPGGKNTFIERSGKELRFAVKACEKEDIYRPSVNKAFLSAASSAGKDTIAVILTGMGDDGARGMLLLRQAGACTIAQSKETSMIFGMPRRAIELGGIEYVAHLEDIGPMVNSLIKQKSDQHPNSPLAPNELSR